MKRKIAIHLTMFIEPSLLEDFGGYGNFVLAMTKEFEFTISGNTCEVNKIEDVTETEIKLVE